MDPVDLIAAQRLIRHVPVGESVVDAILTLVTQRAAGNLAHPRGPAPRLVGAWGRGRARP